MTPEISIIIPAYNRERFIAITLDSLIAQTFSNWECIVVDDGSSDQTFAIAQQVAQRDPRIRAVTKPNAGVARARNHGYSLSNPQSPFVTFMDSDDLYHPEALALMRQVLLDDPHAAAVHCLADMIDPAGNPLNPGTFAAFCRERLGLVDGRIRPLDVSQPIAFGNMLVKGIYPPGTVLTRRSAQDKAGLFDPDFRAGDDFEILIRVNRQGHFRLLDRVLLYYRRHDGNLSVESVRRNRREFGLAWYKTFRSPHNTREQRRILKRSYAAYQLMKCSEKTRLIRQSLAQRSPSRALRYSAHFALYYLRYLRGFPGKTG
ncbi:MAG TPA: glycosyltransferase family 2 protein [Phycisphaerae bacterium]|nr:glycosyltransferase family 2 protein [Phycisphaerae bacterium]